MLPAFFLLRDADSLEAVSIFEKKGENMKAKDLCHASALAAERDTLEKAWRTQTSALEQGADLVAVRVEMLHQPSLSLGIDRKVIVSAIAKRRQAIENELCEIGVDDFTMPYST
jgi:hypothetical protein